MTHGHPNKDAFRKNKRETSSEEVMRVAKKRGIPPPTAY